MLNYSYKNNTMNWNKIIHYATKGNLPAPRRIEKTAEEWQAILTAEQFRIMRQHGTERAFTGEFCERHEAGRYACACCQTILFDSTQKYDSYSGWPSFTEPVAADVLQYHKDTNYGMVRVEVLCNVCDAHLGHVFPDGPPPTALRFCINSAALTLANEA